MSNDVRDAQNQKKFSKARKELEDKVRNASTESEVAAAGKAFSEVWEELFRQKNPHLTQKDLKELGDMKDFFSDPQNIRDYLNAPEVYSEKLKTINL